MLLIDSSGAVRGGLEGPSKRKKERGLGHEQQCGDCRGKEGGWRWKSAWGLHDNGKMQEKCNT